MAARRIEEYFRLEWKLAVDRSHLRPLSQTEGRGSAAAGAYTLLHLLEMVGTAFDWPEGRDDQTVTFVTDTLGVVQ